MKDTKIMKVITVFTRYTIAYASNPDSKESDNLFDIMKEGLYQLYDEELTERLIDILCKVDSNNQITYQDNLKEFFNII